MFLRDGFRDLRTSSLRFSGKSSTKIKINVGHEAKKCTHGMNSRNLIVCIDGTANQFGEKACYWFRPAGPIADVV
jgi:hypothetical protein